MVPESYRRVWRRRLRRRPLLPWLLASTLAANLLSVVLVKTSGFVDSDLGEYLLPTIYGSYLAQVMLLSVWLMSSRAGFLSRLLVTLLGSCLGGLSFAPALDENAIYGIVVCLTAFAYGDVVAGLGLLSQKIQVGLKELPEGVSLVVSPRPRRLVPALWRRNRWSISTLLLATTIVAVCAAILATAGLEGMTKFLTDEIAMAIFLTAAVSTWIINEAAKRSQEQRTLMGIAAATWLFGAVAFWRNIRDFGIAFSLLYQLGVVTVAFAWCAGLQVRKPLFRPTRLGKAARTEASVSP